MLASGDSHGTCCVGRVTNGTDAKAPPRVLEDIVQNKRYYDAEEEQWTDSEGGT
jgi:hypothetical protein